MSDALDGLAFDGEEISTNDGPIATVPDRSWFDLALDDDEPQAKAEFDAANARAAELVRRANAYAPLAALATEILDALAGMLALDLDDDEGPDTRAVRGWRARLTEIQKGGAR